jgi:hypothetical protein
MSKFRILKIEILTFKLIILSLKSKIVNCYLVFVARIRDLRVRNCPILNNKTDIFISCLGSVTLS